jgi:hypothetical protein
MTESNETPIGSVRTDYTEKPEATVLRAFAQFAPSLQEHLRDPQQPPIAIVTSQAAQYSELADFQIEAQRRAVRALAYDAHLPAYMIAENQIAKLGTPKLAILPSPQALAEATWRALLQYVDAGGNLLITGPIDRDDHWQVFHRALDLGVQAHVEPLTYHNASLKIGNHSVALAFGQSQQGALDSLVFDDGSTLKEMTRGKGRIFWAAYPVELAEDARAAADLYAYVASQLNITPMFAQQSPITPGVLVFPTALADSILYVLISDSANDAAIKLRDESTGVPVEFTLPAEHAAIAVIGKKEKKIVARFGF